MEIKNFIFFANSKIVQARLVLCGHAPSGILSGGFPQLLCCLCLTARTRCTTVRLRAAAGRRLVLAKNSALKLNGYLR